MFLIFTLKLFYFLSEILGLNYFDGSYFSEIPIFELNWIYIFTQVNIERKTKFE